jgi:cyanate permease
MVHSEAVGAPPAKQRYRRHVMVVAGAALTMTAGQFVFLSSGFVNPPLAESLGTGLSQVMVYNSLMSVSGVFAMTFLAPVLYRRLGVRKVMIIFGLWGAASLAAVSFVTSLAMLYVLGFAFGLVFGLVTMMAASLLVNTWFEQSRGAVMGAVFAFSGLGGVSAGLVLPAAVASAGWELGFTLLAGVVLLFTVGSALFLVRSDPAHVGLRPFGVALDVPVHPDAATAVEVPGVPARTAFRSPQFAALILGIVLFGAVQAVQQHFAPMVAERGVTLAVGGTILSLMALATVATNLVVGTLNDRRGTTAAVMLALGSQALGMAGFAVAVGFLPLALSTVVFAFAVAFPGVLIPILVMLFFGPRDFGTLLGPTMAAMPAGVAFGAPLWGVVRDATGSYTPMLIASAAVSVLIALLLGWAIRTAPGLRSRVERDRRDARALS